MLSKNVKYLRKNKGYTFRALAIKCSISTRSIKAIEDGISLNPTIRIVDKLAKEFNVTIDDLLHKDFTKE
ncbi:helix-turn-helix transcriptional regulator [Clostridium baratii]|uniref:helix-turn-helix domain-containing protein n=1 Tax=Clostridium baratii TaxID=1561 RepID=UPI0030D0BDEB